MAKKIIEFEIDSFGKYAKWDKGSRELPKLLEFTQVIEAIPGNEFGMILNIRKGRGEKIEYCIKHPPIKDDSGNLLPDFKGVEFIKFNDYKFFIGDCIWEPIQDKIGNWIVTVYYKGGVVAEKSFSIIEQAVNTR